MASAQKIAVSLTSEETRALLEDVPAVYHTRINDVLLTALALALTDWTGSSVVSIDLEGHGREDIFADINVSRTVGWFTSLFPVVLDLQGAEEIGEALKTVKEQLRQMPDHGIGYGILRYLSNDPEIAARPGASANAEIQFNYLGLVDQQMAATTTGIFQKAPFSSEPHFSTRGQRSHLLDVTCAVSNSQFQAVWTYSEKLHRYATIEQVARTFLDALRAIITHCQSPDAGGYTPSDFPHVAMSQEQLDEILVELDLDE